VPPISSEFAVFLIKKSREIFLCCRFPVRQFSLHFSTFQWGFRASANLCLNISEVLSRKIQILQLVLLIAESEHQFPVSLLYLGNDLDCSQSKICI